MVGNINQTMSHWKLNNRQNRHCDPMIVLFTVNKYLLQYLIRELQYWSWIMYLGYCIPPCKYEQEDIHDLDLEVSDLQATRQRTNVDIDSSAQWFWIWQEVWVEEVCWVLCQVLAKKMMKMTSSSGCQCWDSEWGWMFSLSWLSCRWSCPCQHHSSWGWRWAGVQQQVLIYEMGCSSSRNSGGVRQPENKMFVYDFLPTGMRMFVIKLFFECIVKYYSSWQQKYNLWVLSRK